MMKRLNTLLHKKEQINFFILFEPRSLGIGGLSPIPLDHVRCSVIGN